MRYLGSRSGFAAAIRFFVCGDEVSRFRGIVED